MRSTRLLLVTAMLLSTVGCETSKRQAPVPVTDSACVWLKPIIVSPGYETRLTRSEKQQILALDQKIKALCG